MRIAAVLLAAGASRRMRGANKLLCELDGVPLVARAADALIAGGAGPVLAVIGHEAPAVRAALAGRALDFVVHAGWAEGMASSLRAGIAALPGGPDGALIAFGDMPAFRPAAVRALIAAFDPAAGRSICVPVYRGLRGHPVLFGASHFDELGALRGDVGARELLLRHAERIASVPVEDAGVHLDVDTPEALAALRARSGGR